MKNLLEIIKKEVLIQLLLDNVLTATIQFLFKNREKNEKAHFYMLWSGRI